MADEENETGTETGVAAEAPKGGMMKMLLMGGVAVALLVAGVFAGPAIKNMIVGAPEEEGEIAAESVVETSGPAIYQSLHPPLVINLLDSYGDSHFMQITLEVMSRDQEVINAVREHTPAIRNALILYFGTAKYDEVVTREGKEQLLAQALTEVQGVMQERIGEPGIEAAYFTSLIVQ
jgi:flagellar FliL protein